MPKLFRRVVIAWFLIILSAGIAFGGAVFPLAPPNTSSPRATLQSFLKYTDNLSKGLRLEGAGSDEVEKAWDMSIRCLDLSQVPPSVRDSVARETVLKLREILDRLHLPQMGSVPDVDEVLASDMTFWMIPHTEITIRQYDSGIREGNFLFSAHTVEQITDFYESVRELPYQSGAAQGIYEEFIYASGWMIPDGLIGALPEWMEEGYLGQAVWQWAGLVLVFSIAIVVMLILRKCHAVFKPSKAYWQAQRLIMPLCGITVCVLVEYFIKVQINITGNVLVYISMGLEAFIFLFTAHAIIVFGNIAMRAIISSRRIKEEALDADVIKLVCRLISLALVFVLIYWAGSYFGLPVTAVFASAGIVGVAVALAARETLANFFGGVSIFLDRPFRAGDYIVLDSGERGEVKAVGMRSTRLLTRDDVLITIPNSVITNVKIVNQSAPQPNLRVSAFVGVAYDSDVDLVESVMLDVAKDNPLLLATPAPVVRFVEMGDFAITFRLMGHVRQPRDRGRALHEINKELLRRFNEAGIEIPIPQQDVFVRSQS